jgi:hypothetical protein
MPSVSGPAVQLVRVVVMAVFVARIAVDQAALVVGDNAGVLKNRIVAHVF